MFVLNAFYENFAIHLAIIRFLKPWKRFLSIDGPCSDLSGCEVGRWGVKREILHDNDLVQNQQETAMRSELGQKTPHKSYSEVVLGS